MKQTFTTDIRTDFSEAVASANRYGSAMQKAKSIGLKDEAVLDFADAAEKAFRSVASVMFKTGRRGRGGRPKVRSMRRELVRAGLEANGVPPWVQKLVWLGRLAAYVLPAPFNVIVPAVLWMVEQMISADDE